MPNYSAIRRACTALGTLELNDCILYTNVAPCCMCMSAALWATVDEVRYLVGMQASEAIGLGDAHFYDELARPADERLIASLTELPILQDEALANSCSVARRVSRRQRPGDRGPRRRTAGTSPLSCGRTFRPRMPTESTGRAAGLLGDSQAEAEVWEGHGMRRSSGGQDVPE